MKMSMILVIMVCGFLSDAAFAGRERSIARFIREPGKPVVVDSKTIVITGKKIRIQEKTSSRKIPMWTGLVGDNGSYEFKNPGEYEILPGTYEHFANGTLFQAGELKSTIWYNY